MAECCCCLDLELEDDALTLDVGDASLEWGSDEYVRVVNADAETYAGPYEATPTEDAQTLATQAKLMTADFIVAPIPTNYGRITYDGTTIHIS